MFAALIAVIVVAAMFISAEYRRGLIRVTFAASPARAQVLAAKAVVVGAVTFVAGLAGGAGAVAFGTALLRSNGNFILPVSAPTEVRVLAGTAALLAVIAVLAVAVGAILRSGAAAVTALIVADRAAVPAGHRAARAAGERGGLAAPGHPDGRFAIEQTVQRYAQVAANYTPRNGYYPLPPWAGFAVFCAWAALAVGRGRRPAPPEGRMSDPSRAEWTKLRTLAGHGLAAAGRGRADRGAGRPGRHRDPLPGRRLPRRPGQDRPDRHRPRPGRGRRPGRDG